MVCPELDTEKNFCNKLGVKFYTGMERPCEYISDWTQCPLVVQRGLA